MDNLEMISPLRYRKAAAGKNVERMRVMIHFARWLVGLDHPHSQTNERERASLIRHATGRRKLVEIGVWEGLTTTGLRQAMLPDAELLCVDPYPIGRLGFSTQQIIARRELSRIPNGSIRWIRATGADAGHAYALSTEGPVDFVFIDGDHTYEGIRNDWTVWSKLVAIGGIVALHDSRSSPERNIEEAGSVAFTRDVIHKDSRYRLLEEVDTLTVVQRV
jgi:predicted O-methyltransferase YrrM